MRLIKVKLKNGKIPRRAYRLDQGNSVALMHRDSGKLMGRVKSPKSDGTQVRRIKKGYDVDGDGISDGGQIFGRSKAVRVKSSKRSRGYVRRL